MDIFNCKIKGRVIYEDRLYETSELIKMTNNIKTFVLNNFRENKVIAIAMPRCVYLLTSILALLESKITYLPIDVDFLPEQRINYILNSSEISTVLTVSSYDYNFCDRNVVYVDEIKEYETENILSSNCRLAYLLYTSGTTGFPKGVKISRTALNNFIIGITEIIKFDDNDRIISHISPSFDIFFLEAILPLYLGLTVVLASSQEIKNSKKIIDLIRRYSINMLQITPSGLRLLSMVDKNLTFLDYIHTIMVGGEVFPIELLDRLQQKKNLKIYNMYGPTETTIWSCIADLSNGNYIHLGEPICNTDIYLLDNNLNNVKNGTQGEICISGKGLADGYYNNEELTKSKFCKLPQIDNNIVYRTGDIGVIDNDGKLLYIGRIDNQIKFHGHRIELEEIEHIILSLEKVTSAAVCFDEKNEKLIAFYISVDGNINQRIYDLLKLNIPEYMLPNKLISVNSFIYTSSGKIDRNSMLKQYYEKENNNFNSYEDIDNAIKNVINLTIIKCLHIQACMIDYQMPLINLGFDSITYVEFIVELENALKLNFDENILMLEHFENLNQLYEYVTVLKIEGANYDYSSNK